MGTVIGTGCKFGEQVIIEDDVVIGNNCKIGHRVTLKTGTVIGSNSVVDDHCITTGACWIGSNVNVRTGAIISKATVIEDWVFIGPGVVTNHTKHVDHGRREKSGQLVTYICFGSVIGSQASLVAGLYVGPHSIVGAGSVVTKSLPGDGVYFGSPCVRRCDIGPDDRVCDICWGDNMYRTDEVFNHLKKYIPGLEKWESPSTQLP